MFYILENTFRVCKRAIKRGTWVAQSVKHPTLDFCSGHDLTLVRLSPSSGPALTEWSLLQFSPSLSAHPPLMLCLSKVNKCLKKKKYNCNQDIAVATGGNPKAASLHTVVSCEPIG